MRRSLAIVLASLVPALPLTGCSLFGPRTQTIKVSSEPSGAEVIVNGRQAGRTPLQHAVHRGENLLLEVRKEGYETAFRSSHRSLSTLGILDVVGGALFLVPFIGLVSSAAWEHEPASYGVTLSPEEEAGPE